MFPVMTADELVQRLLALGIDSQPSFYDVDDEEAGLIESLMHEAAHMVVLGLKPRRRGVFDAGVSGDIHERIDAMEPLAADWQEIKTIAVQVLASDRLGVELDDGTLTHFAAAEMRSARYGQETDRVRAAVKCLLGCASTRRRVEHLVDLVTARP